jgi:hypothetical protein
MEKLARYRQLVQQMLLEYSKVKPAYGDKVKGKNLFP